MGEKVKGQTYFSQETTRKVSECAAKVSEFAAKTPVDAVVLTTGKV